MKLTPYTASQYASANKDLLPLGQAWKWPDGGFGDALIQAESIEFERLQNYIDGLVEYAPSIHQPAQSSWHISEYRRVANEFLAGISTGAPPVLTERLLPGYYDYGINDLASFARAGDIGTYFNASGVLINAAANQRRIDHDPLTLQPKGLLIENSATNLSPYSEQLNNTGGGWARSQMATVTPNAAIAPDGTMTADLLVPNATTSNHYIENQVGWTITPDGQLACCAAYFKKKDFARASLNFVYKNGSGSTLEYRFIDERITVLGQGTNNTGVTWKVEKLPNGWYRLIANNMNVDTGGTVPRVRLFMADDCGAATLLWGKVAAFGFINVTPGPLSARSWTGDSLIEQAANNVHNASLTHVFRAGKALITEVYFKEIVGSAKRYGVIVVGSGIPMLGNQGCVVDVALGAIVFTTGTAGTYQIVDDGAGWWKVTARFMPTGSGNGSVQVRLGDVNNTVTPAYLGDGVSGLYVAGPYSYSENYIENEPVYTGGSSAATTGDGVKGTYAWGAHTQKSAVMGTYIPTAATAVTRNADIAEIYTEQPPEESELITGISEKMPRTAAAIGSKIGKRLWSAAAPTTTFIVPLLQIEHLLGPARIGSKVGQSLWGNRSRYVMRVRYYRSVVDPKPLWDLLNAFKQAHVYLWFEDITGVGGHVNYAQN